MYVNYFIEIIVHFIVQFQILVFLLLQLRFLSFFFADLLLFHFVVGLLVFHLDPGLLFLEVFLKLPHSYHPSNLYFPSFVPFSGKKK